MDDLCLSVIALSLMEKSNTYQGWINDREAQAFYGQFTYSLSDLIKYISNDSESPKLPPPLPL
jgi:hypothetical protein